MTDHPTFRFRLNRILISSFCLVAATATRADTAAELAAAMDVPAASLDAATYSVLANAEAAKVRATWGVSAPFNGSSLAVLSTGKAATPTHPGYAAPSPGTSFGTLGNNPAAGQSSCGIASEPATIYDPTELVLTLKVPANTIGFRLKFNFFAAEYPEWVCSSVNDRFMIRLSSERFNGNIAFDSQTNEVSLNTALFTVTSGGELVGTGMEGGVGGAIGWQTVRAEAVPGETITLRFLIFDAVDGTGDSVAVIDGFEWVRQGPAFEATIYPAVEVGWPTESDKHYQVEWASVLDTNVWFDLGPAVPGNGKTNYMFDTTRGNSERFYRVRELP